MFSCVHPVRLALLCSLFAHFASETSASLVTWYKFDEGTGTTANDSSGNGGHLTANGTTAWNQKTGAPFGGSAHFNGGTFRATRYNSASIQPQTIDLLRARTGSRVSIAFWANPDTANQVNTGAFGYVNGAANRILQNHLLWSNGNVYWDVGYGTTTTSYYRLNALGTSTAAAWTHWVFQFDASSSAPMKIYRNKTLEFTGTGGAGGTINWAGIDTVDIGGALGLSTTWKGSIDDFALWDEAITQAQIDSIYGGGVQSLVQPQITSFTARPGNISAGTSATLSWAASGATSVSISNGVGTVAATGSLTVSPSDSTTYTLTASSGSGSVTKSTLVGVGLAESDFALTELMAENSGTFLDEDGNASDWIELRNPNPFDKSLLNWKLQNGLTTWTFPDAVIPGNGYLVVFASGLNRVNPAGKLHTNFKLSKSGETVQLLRPDSTVSSALAFPAQKAPYSYGTTTSTSGAVPLVSDGQTGVLRYLVPTASTPSTWNTSAYDASTWTAGADTSIGFDSDLAGLTSFIPHFKVNLGTPTTGVAHPMWNVNPSLYTRYTFNVADKSVLSSLLLKLKYEDGFVAWLNGVEIARGNFTGTPAWNSATGANRASENLSLVYDSFDVSATGLPALVNGANVLAIQGMNFSASSSDFLIAPLLEGSSTQTQNLYMVPTPGAANGEGFTGFVKDTVFSVKRGLYTAAQTVAITSATPGATIRYTTNGSAPTLSNGTTYTAPLSISATTTVRAAAFLAGLAPTNVDTNTYVFPAAVASSLQASANITSTDIPNLQAGLTDLPSVSFVFPATSTLNDSTEIPLSVEWLNPDGTPGFQIDCGAKQFGGAFTQFNKESFRLQFRSEYGQGRLNYPVFAGFDRGLKAADSFDSIEIRNGSHDMAARGFYMSNTFADDTLLDMGQIAPHGRYIHLYINGAYWGMYHLRERWGADMISHYLGGSKTSYEAINGNLNVGGWADPGTPYDGDGSAWTRIKNNRASYAAVKPYLDVKDYVDYMVMWMFGNAEHEYRCAGPTVPGAGFRFFLNDADGYLNGTTNVWDSNGNNTGYNTPSNRTLPGDGPGGIFSSLFIAADPDYRTLLADRIQRHFIRPGGVMTAGANKARLSQRLAQVDRAIIAECAKWGYRTTTTWRTQRDYTLATWFDTRATDVTGQYRTTGFYPSFEAPTFSQQGGSVSSGSSLTMTAPSGGSILYTTDGSDPRLPGGNTSPKAVTASTLTISQNTLVRARAKSGATWSALNEAFFQTTDALPSNHLAITEINYNPAGTASEEFVEFTNLGTHAINLRGVVVNGGIFFTFPDNYDTVLAPGQRLLLVENRLDFETRYGLELPIAGVYSGQLNNAGDSIVLTLPAAATPYFTLDFGDSNGWPAEADGGGRTLVLTNRTPGALPSAAANWQASSALGGSPNGTDLAVAYTAPPSTTLPFTGQLTALGFPSGASLTYSKTSGPSWLTVSPTGALSGTPAAANAGANSFGISVSDGATTVTGTLALTVNHTPAFAANPIAANATGGSPFAGQLSATDADTVSVLSFTKQSGPAWLSVSPTGALSGTPANANAGLNAFTVAVSDGTATVTATLNVTVTPTGPSFNAFAASRFTPGEQADPLVSGPAADPDHDGIPNLLEYAFGLDPKSPASSAVPKAQLTTVVSSQHIGLTYTRLKGATDLTFTPEFSSSPSDAGFTASAFTEVGVQDNGDGTETVTIRDAAPVTGAPRFARLRVTQN